MTSSNEVPPVQMTLEERIQERRLNLKPEIIFLNTFLFSIFAVATYSWRQRTWSYVLWLIGASAANLGIATAIFLFVDLNDQQEGALKKGFLLSNAAVVGLVARNRKKKARRVL